jgi:pimeloyl-ACP methyl ester carboxylesterase
MFRSLLCFVIFISTTLQARSFPKLLDQYFEGRGDLSQELEESAKDYHYVFVSGFLNERAPFYWHDAKKQLRNLGVRSKDITIINPNSRNTVAVNSDLLKNELLQIETTKPIWLISHSKGAMEAFDFAWKHPDIVLSKNIKALVFIQGTFGGSFIAEELAGELALGVDLPWYLRFGIEKQFNLEHFLLTFVTDHKEALLDMSPRAATKWLSHLKLQKTDLHDEINSRLFFIASSQNHDGLSLYMKNPGLYLSTYHGQNDGLVLTKTQYVPSVGKILGFVRADHVDFIGIWPVTKQPRKFRYAFMKALLHTLADTQ